MTALCAPLAPRPRDAGGPTGEPLVEEPDMSTGAIFILCVVAAFPIIILIAVGIKLRELFEARRWPETTGKVLASRVTSLEKDSGSDSMACFTSSSVKWSNISSSADRPVPVAWRSPTCPSGR